MKKMTTSSPNCQALKFLWQLDRKWFLAASASSIANAWSPLLTVYLTSETLNILCTGDAPEKMLGWAAALAATLMVTALIKSILHRCAIAEENIISQRETVLLQKKLVTLPYEDMEDPALRQKRRKIEEAARINNFGMGRFRDGICGLITNLAMLIGTIFFLTEMIHKLAAEGSTLEFSTLALIIASVILFIAEFLLTGWAERKAASVADEVSALMIEENRIDDAVDSYQMGKDVRLFGLKETILQIKELALHSHQKAFRLMYRQKFRANIPVRMVYFSGQTLLWIAIVKGVFAGALDSGSILRYFNCGGWITGSLLGVLQMKNALRFNSPFVEEYLSYLYLPEAPVKNEGTFESMPSLKNDFVFMFNNVSFRYPGTDTYALQDISLRICSGDIISVVGKNGSGKTTLIKLLCRLYAPTEGEITLNGINIDHFNPEEYRRELAVVFQDFKLFPFSLEENILPNKEKNIHNLQASLQRAGLSAFVDSLPLGWKTPLYKDFSEDGIEISGGEAQKIAIARAFARNADFLILDEPTAALDPLAEEEIMDTVRHETVGKTTLYISHRLSTTRFSNKIVVLDNGKLVQCGNHRELMQEKDGLYSVLWKAQASFYEH